MDGGAVQNGIGVVVIGRNEGERLARCLRSLGGKWPLVYVDSGSTDDSAALAERHGAVVVRLVAPPNFTAARARNAGIAQLREMVAPLLFVQTIDGDCEVSPGWIEQAACTLTADGSLGAVFGRRRERFPSRSIYNALCDEEWNIPVGEAAAFGGDVMLRITAFDAVGGYDPTMIAGEDPDTALRMRGEGWRLERLDADMTLHDAAIIRFIQWWRRTERAGHAFADLAQRHPASCWPDWQKSRRRIVFWGGVAPAVIGTGILLAWLHDPAWFSISALLLAAFLANVGRIARQARRTGLRPRLAAATGWFLMLGKLPEFIGLASYGISRFRGRKPSLIEYKGAAVS